MRILAVTGVHVPSAGGGEHSFFETLTFLESIGAEIRVITAPSKRRSGKWAKWCYEAPLLAPEAEIAQHMAEWRPNIIFTQMIWSDIILDNHRANRTPVVYFARNAGGNLDLSPGRETSPDLVVSNSEDTRRALRERWGCDSFVLYPVVLDTRFCYKRNDERSLYLMVNPLLIKGGDVFRQIAILRPSLNFAAIYGWEQFRVGELPHDAWSPSIIVMLRRARRRSTVSMPSFVKLDDIKNITILPVTDEIESVFHNTRVVLVPSRWREALCRTIVEAAACGVPSIASASGGISEGPILQSLLLPADARPSDWVRLIDHLKDPADWAAASEEVMTKYQAYRYNVCHQLKAFHQKLNELCTNAGTFGHS